jgi:hypothetical protein
MIDDLQEDVLAVPGGDLRVRRARPFGLWAIIFLLTLQAATGVAVLVLTAIGTLPMPGPVGERPPGFYLALLGLILTLPAAIGMWAGRRWGWYLTMLLLALSMSTEIWEFFHGRPDYLSMLLNVLIVFYLNQQEVRNLFVGQAPAEESLAVLSPASQSGGGMGPEKHRV